MFLVGKVAIVTGGANGIGREICLALGDQGANVVIADTNIEAAKSLSVEIAKRNGIALAYHCDVTDYEQVSNMIRNITEERRFTIGVLVNNAGITRDKLLIRMSKADWDAVMNVNLNGTFNCTQAVTQHMMRNKAGYIVNIASVIGLIGNPGQANYAAAKSGIIGFTKATAKELGPRGIRVNAIAPGFIETEMTANLDEKQRAKIIEATPLGCFGQPEDVAKVVLNLCSGDFDFTTGQVINIDGGMVM